MKWVTNLPCVVCGRVTENGNALHHIYTRKAYPEHSKESWNLIPVTQDCHNMFHSNGTEYMASKYPRVKDWLLDNNWYQCELTGKWRHE